MRAGSFNIYKHLNAARTADDLGDFLATPDLTIAGLQEINWNIGADDLPAGWRAWQPNDREARKDPVVWRGHDLVAKGSRLVSDRIENDAGVVTARFGNWAVLDTPGGRLAFIDHHANASVEKPPGHPKDLPRQREHHDGLIGLVALADDLERQYDCDAVLIVGDFNVDYGADKRVQHPEFPYRVFTEAVFSCVWELGEQSTRSGKPNKGRTIDQAWGRNIRFTDVMTPTHWGDWARGDVESDHLPIIFDFEIVRKPRKGMVAGMKFVSRDEWGATRRRPTRATHAIGRTLGVTLHWEGPGMGGFPHRLCARKVRSIERFHEVNRGWAGIAYNAIVCPHGYVFEGRGAGIKSAANGYGSVNDDWHAVCYLGGVGDDFTPEGKQGFKHAIAWLRDKGNAGPRVNGHRDHKSTQCPGDQIYRWIQNADFDDLEGVIDINTRELIHELLTTKIPMVGHTAKVKAERSVEQALAMAVNRAGHAQENAAVARDVSQRNADAIREMSKALPVDIREAVEDVLNRKIKITVEGDDV